jgi:hypothetical protein
MRDDEITTLVGVAAVFIIAGLVMLAVYVPGATKYIVGLFLVVGIPIAIWGAARYGKDLNVMSDYYRRHRDD